MRILISDFDGTLYVNGQYKDKDLKAIHDFQEDDGIFIICTGRGVNALRDVLPAQLKPDLIIAASGAYMVKGFETIYSADMPFGTVKRIFEKFRDSRQTVTEIIADGNAYFADHYGRFENDLTIDHFETGSLQGISFDYPDEDLEDAADLKNRIAEAIPEVTIHLNRNCVDITLGDVSKGSAVNIIRNIFPGVRIYAAGDAENDLAMLEAADVSFTFDHAPEKVREKCDYIIDSIADMLHIMDNEKAAES